MILRIRLPSGATERVTITDADDASALATKIDALNKLDGEYSLFSDPRFAKPFSLPSARHGDMVFVKGSLKTDPASSSNADTSSSSAPATAPSVDPRCRKRHGPRGMCELCAPKEDKSARMEKARKEMGERASSIAVLEAMEALKHRISPQEAAHAAAAAVNSDAANSFQAYLGDTGFSQQRVGLCFGSSSSERIDVPQSSSINKLSTNITEQVDAVTTNVNVIYEPPQVGDSDTYALVADDEAGDITPRAHRVATDIGLQLVGVVLSARPRKCILSAKDIVFACKLLASLDDEAQRKAFIVFVVSLSESNEVVFEAYQVSDLALELYEADVFEDIDKQKANGGRVLCKTDVLIEGKDTRKVPTEFFMLNIPIKSCDSWLTTKFPVENRDIAPQNPNQIQQSISDQSVDFQKRLADFHLLLFLSNVFDIKNDMPRICKAVKDNEEIDEGYRLMIENMAST